jgi:hypothetical protein
MKSVLHACSFLFVAVIAASLASAQTVSIPAGSGTLNYTVQVRELSCVPAATAALRQGPEPKIVPGTEFYSESTYSGFSYVASGVTTPLPGTVQTIMNTNAVCAPPSSHPVTDLFAPPVFPFKSQLAISFTPSGTTGGSASVSSATPGMLYPRYQVQSIIYDTPGNGSSNGFSNTKTDGTTTTIGGSFQSGDTTTFSVSTGFLGLGSTISWSSGNSLTTGNSTTVTQTITNATGVTSASNHNSSNVINHIQDLFVIWINPAVVVFQTGANSIGFYQGTQLQTAGDPNPGEPEAYQDQVEVTAQAMMANAQGVTTVPVNILEPVKMPDGETLPGLAVICANPSFYPNSCTLANQCGCVPSDFAPILARDPLLNFSSTESPLNADTSGAAICAKPAASSSCRYVPVQTGPNSGVQKTELLEGPNDAGGITPVTSFTQSDSNQTTQTLSESSSYTVALSEEASFKFLGTGISLKNANQWTWTNSESTGEINGYAHSMNVSLSSSTVGCDQEIPVFEDTVYHTFVFMQPSGNSSCP